MAFTVVGLGSEAAGDDAIGLILVDQLQERLQRPRPGWERAAATCVLWPEADALTVAYDLLALGDGVLLVDCADLGLEPGSARLLAPGEVRVTVKHSPVSVHGIGLAEGLELAARLGFSRPVHLFAVQPADLAPGAPLSAPLRERLPGLLDELEAAARRLAGRETVTG
jgi:hydrogenase maturation protease